MKSKIIFLHWIKNGDTIGYGRTFTAERDSLIGTVPIGYSDGLRRSLSNRLKVEVNKKLCKIVGKSCMDVCMIDLTDMADEVKLYDVVTFIGSKTRPGNGPAFSHTIPYEIICLIGTRVPRLYLKDGVIQDIYYP